MLARPPLHGTSRPFVHVHIVPILSCGERLKMRPCVTDRLNEGAPSFPFFVMIWITPTDASVPYNVAAAGPLMISMLSMSAGLKSSSGWGRGGRGPAGGGPAGGGGT